MKSLVNSKIYKFAFVAFSAIVLAQGATAREGLIQRLKNRHETATIVVQKDGTPAVQWKDGQVSPVVKSKDGKLEAFRVVSPLQLKQSNGQPIRVVPAVSK